MGLTPIMIITKEIRAKSHYTLTALYNAIPFKPSARIKYLLLSLGEILYEIKYRYFLFSFNFFYFYCEGWRISNISFVAPFNLIPTLHICIMYFLLIWSHSLVVKFMNVIRTMVWCNLNWHDISESALRICA